MAGQISVSIAAGANRLEIPTRMPDDTVQLGESDSPPLDVSAAAATTGNRAATVPLNACGPGCFIGSVAWRTGTTSIDILVGAPGWQGGHAVFTVPWAPQRNAELLRKVRAAMRTENAIRVVESVTTDTSHPDPPANTLTVSGPEFLESEPYGAPARP
ncbi:MAG: hypothetical protein HOV67_30860 [Kribbellaceae bacterium]|nr:hypothetical protein [Catenulispora sp.]NUR99646.1 hypothetical protein [Kribbellaceae bacterium]